MKRAVALSLVGIVAVAALTTWLANQATGPRRVARVASDPALEAKIAEARAELPQFRRELASGAEGRFAIRARFQTPAGPEVLWVRDPVFVRGDYVGWLDQAPMVLNQKAGDRVTVAEVDVVDWLIIRGEQRLGGFTEPK